MKEFEESKLTNATRGAEDSGYDRVAQIAPRKKDSKLRKRRRSRLMSEAAPTFSWATSLFKI